MGNQGCQPIGFEELDPAHSVGAWEQSFSQESYDGILPHPMPTCSLTGVLQYEVDVCVCVLLYAAKFWDDLLCGSSLRYHIRIQIKALRAE
jgi:hypothetical protein